jgi:hypothetical protein
MIMQHLKYPLSHHLSRGNTVTSLHPFTSLLSSRGIPGSSCPRALADAPPTKPVAGVPREQPVLFVDFTKVGVPVPLAAAIADSALAGSDTGGFDMGAMLVVANAVREFDGETANRLATSRPSRKWLQQTFKQWL